MRSVHLLYPWCHTPRCDVSRALTVLVCRVPSLLNTRPGGSFLLSPLRSLRSFASVSYVRENSRFLRKDRFFSFFPHFYSPFSLTRPYSSPFCF